MIPYKLRLRNFLSYKEPPEPLDFSGMHLVCLIGANGHGKSALLDAITWVLWGKARGSDDDLMHAGSTEMEVAFEFALGGQRYHVMRKRYGKGKTKKSMLELAVWDEAQQAWQPLTEPSLRATQRRIIDILRMDYDTFTDSAFLRQGQADAFTGKTPAERKKVLAKILNLDVYDSYAEEAKNRAKEAEAAARHLQQQLDELDAELAQRPRLLEEEQTQRVLETQERLAHSEARQAVLKLRAEISKLEGQQALQNQLTHTIAATRRDLMSAEAQLQKKRQSLQAQAALLARRTEIEEAYQQLLAARNAENRWQERWQVHQRIDKKRQQLQQKLAVARANLEKELAQARQQADELQKLILATDVLIPKARAVQAEIAELQPLRDQQQTQMDQLAKLRAESEQLEGIKKRIEKEGEKLKERLRVLQTDVSSACPVCKQPLGPDGRQHLQEEYEAQRQALRREWRQAQENLAANAARQQALKSELNETARKLRQLPALEKQLAQIEARLQQSNEAAERLPALQEQIDQLEKSLAADFAPELHAQLTAVQAELDAAGYDAAAHEAARQKLQRLRSAESQYVLLQEALQQQADLTQEVESLQERVIELQQRLRQSEAELEAVEQTLAELPALQAEFKRKKQEEAAAHARWEQANARLVGVQQQILALQALESKRKEVARQWSQQKSRASRFRQLQQAFGRSGVQAMIIENALPELEAEANHLLRKLTDGRMNVQLPTTRIKKTGGVRETLDIIISDELGTRPYELYSGGEAFRVDLALRIALSRLLARRAGAALQTLFIDEGFGTQDAHGRENLVDTIHMIKDEFALVLIITHIEELKDQFPVRIQVNKDEINGSYYVVE